MMMAPKYGTCPVCGHTIPVFNYTNDGTREDGYLSRHSPSGVVGGKDVVTTKCRGSFGHWIERTGGA